MRATKRTWQNLVYILLLLAAVCLLFRWYSTTNNRQIEERNLNYAKDSARQTAKRIGSELINAQRRVHNYTYLLSMTLDQPGMDAELLRELEENSSFDAFLFTDAEGISLASDGTTSDSRDRDYFRNGMQGESGPEVPNSRGRAARP